MEIVFGVSLFIIICKKVMMINVIINVIMWLNGLGMFVVVNKG